MHPANGAPASAEDHLGLAGIAPHGGAARSVSPARSAGARSVSPSGVPLGSCRVRSHSQSGLPRALETARRNLRIVILFGIVDGMDIALLPATFRSLEVAFGLTTGNLATMAAAQGFGMAFGAPFWGTLADNGVSLKLLMAVGSLSWASLLVLLAFTSSFQVMACLRLLNGLCLAMYTPVIQSIVAESTEPFERGTYFGRIEFFRHCVGNFCSMLVVTAISNRTICGMMGWRVAFIAVAVFAMALAAIILTFYQEQPRQWKPEKISVKEEFKKLYSFLAIGSYRVILLQGMFAEMIFASMSFLTMYLQYLGMPDAEAGFVAAMYQLSRGMGYMFGGSIGDTLAQWSPYHGRTLVAQGSCLVSIPLTCLLFAGKSGAVTLVVFALGFFSVWPKTACNKPVLIDVVPDDSISSASAWDRTIEGGVGFTLGPYSISFLATLLFGYNPTTLQVEDLSLQARMTNVNALGNALFLVVATGKLACFLIYGFLHFTYKDDILIADNRHSARLPDVGLTPLPHWAPPLPRVQKDSKEV